MQNNFVWGTHTEIFCMSLYLGKPIFVALNNDKRNEYYWAKFACSQRKTTLPRIFPSSSSIQLQLPPGLDHMELCNISQTHYEVVLTTYQALPCTPPYIGDI